METESRIKENRFGISLIFDRIFEIKRETTVGLLKTRSFSWG